jgi:DNA replication licensing factor MCM2
MPVAVRHIESIIRMSEAHAAMHLREQVTDADVDAAVSVMIKSFVATQKYGVQKALQKRFSKYTNYQRDYHHLLLDALRTLLRETLHYETVMGVVAEPDAPIRLSVRHLEDKAREYDILDLQLFYDSQLFADDNFELHAEEGVITHPR